ncbi:MAG TPA: hypothetical protein VGX68_15630 [Thermoanaerobaculia bacterium]|nr:hypothetical protein [Thermoanaerobaculia bacterium]
MKKALMIAVLAVLCISSVALADSVSITSQASFSSPSGSITSTGNFQFKGPQTITFTVAGKTCNLNGSGRGSVPEGCNYAITVAPNGSISGTLTAGNSVCTQSSQIAASCK